MYIMLRLPQLKLKIIIPLLLVSCFTSLPAAAQISASVRASAPDTDKFPIITIYLAVLDSSGRRIPGLPRSSFSLIEDEVPIIDLAIEETLVGTRQIFVINTNPGLKVRDGLGRSRFEHVQEALLEWWQQPSASPYALDDLSLITGDGDLIAHSPSAAELAALLDRYQPSFEKGLSDYDLMLKALDFAGDPTLQPGMPSFLSFLTPLLHIPRDLPMANLIARANETGTAIFPVLFGEPEILEQPEAEPLRRLAEETGGQLVLYDETTGLTGFATHIYEHRMQYKLTYASQAVTTGNHAVQVRVTGDGLDAISNTINYAIAVEPPDAAFIQPPDQIIRQSDDPSLVLETLPPLSQTLQILITFPDDHPRPITKSQLIVDGQVAAENTAEPFDSFIWDLSNYTDSNSHTIQATLEDSLGLQGKSIPLAVYVEVQLPPRGMDAIRPALGSILAALGILIAGVILAASLIASGRQRSAQLPAQTSTMVERRKFLKRAGLRQKATDQPPEAFLFFVDAEGIEGESVPLSGVDTILGSDPSLTPFPLNDPSVAGIHARLVRQVAGGYLIQDQGSVAGTWVNYEPIPAEGIHLKHCDLIHLGRVALRFRLPSPQPQPEIRTRNTPENSPATLPPHEGET